MKLNLTILGAVALAIAVSSTACKKSISAPEVDDKQTTNQVITQSDDQSRFNAEMESTDAEVISAVEANTDFTGRTVEATGAASTCNAIVMMENTATERRMTITFNGTDCIGTGTRTGSVLVSMPLNTRWKDAGAVLTVNIKDLVITRLSDRKTMTINGTRTITNVSGGKMTQLLSLPQIIHTVNSRNMSITFDDGSIRNWQVARKRVFTYSGGVVLTITGTHETDGIPGIAEWGTSRLGNTFASVISTPLVFRQDCGFRLTAGVITHRGSPVTATVRFALNKTGNPAPCPGSGVYYYQVTWTGLNGAPTSVIRPY